MGRDKKWYGKHRIQRTYMYNLHERGLRGGDAGGLGGRVEGGKEGKIGKSVIA